MIYNCVTCGAEFKEKPCRKQRFCSRQCVRGHGMSDSVEYRAWCHMKERCNNPTCKHYARYGGRGITVCEEWNDSFEQFYKDVGVRPSPEYSLDRKDNEGNYEPTNVRWATKQVQTINRSHNGNNTSGYRGVCWDKRRSKWYAQAMVDRKHIHLGYFDTPLEAHRVYRAHKLNRLATA